MNPDLNRLQPYPFERLAELKTGITPPDLNHIALSIGEPRHPSPDFVLQVLNQSIAKVGQYPLTKGMVELRQAMANWLQTRFPWPITAFIPNKISCRSMAHEKLCLHLPRPS